MTTPPTLFLRLYLDEDVSVLVADLIRAHGFDVKTTREAQNLGHSDLEQLVFSTTEQRTLLTHNRVDFERLHTEVLHQHKPHSGILIARERLINSRLHEEICF